MLVFSSLLLLHLLCATFWVGGMATLHFIVRPAAVLTLAPPQRLPLMAEALRRFLDALVIVVALEWVSGLWMIEVAGGLAVVHRSVHLMLSLGLVMTVIFAVVRWRLLPRLQRAVSAQVWPEAGRQLVIIRSWVGFNLGLGVLVFGVAMLGRVLL